MGEGIALTGSIHSIRTRVFAKGTLRGVVNRARPRYNCLSERPRDRNHMKQALDGHNKAAYVNDMFGRIAERYDLMNALMTAGRDRVWRRLMARMAEIPPGGVVLDLATGTGDVGLAVLEHQPAARVVGVDFAFPMMAVGRRKVFAEGVVGFFFAAADALVLPFRDNSFDAVLHAFLMRNVIDIERGFAEQYRVLKPGRKMVCLEATMPSFPLFRRLFHFGFGTLIPRIGGLVTGQREAYTYLPESILRFPSPERLSAAIGRAGFQEVRYRRVMFGAVAIHAAVKP